jgi:hypothetical protein
VTVYKKLALAAAAAALAFPSAIQAAMIDATLIPDGTYTVKIEKVIDNKHIQAAMDNGSEADLSAGRPTVDFSAVKAGDSVKLSLIKGQVMVFLDQTSH